jgi:hypothetical protein
MAASKEQYLSALQQDAKKVIANARVVVDLALERCIYAGRLSYPTVENISEKLPDGEADFYWQERDRHFESEVKDGKHSYPYWMEDEWNRILDEEAQKVHLRVENYWITWAA